MLSGGKIATLKEEQRGVWAEHAFEIHGPGDPIVIEGRRFKFILYFQDFFYHVEILLTRSFLVPCSISA